MNSFSISQLEQYSGVKAHTIRIWEQRYHALQPQRSEGNTRYYDSTQLRRLLNIVSLMNADHKVSELCSMPDAEIFQLLESQMQQRTATDVAADYFISQLISAALTFDEEHFEKMLSGCLLRFGIQKAYANVLYPTLVRIGLMWANNSIASAQEHFASNLLRQKLCVSIDSLPPASAKDDSWLLFLPEDEFHEIGLLYAHHVIKSSGRKVIYLGSSIPFDTLKDAVKETSPANLLLFFVHYDLPEDVEQYIDTLEKHFSKINIHLSGNAKLLSQLKNRKRIKKLQAIDDLEKHLSN
jgi:MerR family transcriptional regulator, light-induced transcriptional regulator